MLNKESVAVNKEECLRCGHEWIKRVAVSRVCPRCRSPYWNTPRPIKRTLLTRNPHVSEYHRLHVLTTSNGTITGLNKRPHPGVCELCGTSGVKLDYHHWYTNNPSVGMWLCGWCHRFAECIDIGYDDIGLVEKYSVLKSKISSEEPSNDGYVKRHSCPYCGWFWGMIKRMPKHCAVCNRTLWDIRGSISDNRVFSLFRFNVTNRKRVDGRQDGTP